MRRPESSGMLGVLLLFLITLSLHNWPQPVLKTPRFFCKRRPERWEQWKDYVPLSLNAGPSVIALRCTLEGRGRLREQPSTPLPRAVYSAYCQSLPYGLGRWSKQDVTQKHYLMGWGEDYKPTTIYLGCCYQEYRLRR